MKSFSDNVSLNYKKSVFIFTNYLKQLQNFSQTLNLNNLAVSISNTVYRLENNSFTIGVFGNFNCGKSTFINALIGKNILPTDILATTATISRIIHREIPGAKIRFQDGREQEIFLDKLEDYVTKLTSDSEKRAAQIQESLIYYPIPYYQNQLEIIDTPGLNDDEEMTAITSEVIERCDVAIMLISAISPFGITEGEFLTTKLLANGITKILFVINSIDLLDKAEVGKIINSISNRIHICIRKWAQQQPNQEILDKLDKIQIHGISAFQALEAKATRNIPLLAQSWFVNFECALRNIINQERGLIQLQTTCNRVTTYATETLSCVKHQESELAVEIAQLSKAKQTINHRIEQLHRQEIELTTSFNNTLSNLQKQTNLSYSRLETKLKATAKSTISSKEITINTQSDIAKSVLTAVQNATREYAKQIQTEVKNALSLCLMQLKSFAQLCEQFISDLELDSDRKVLEIISLFNQYYDSFTQLNSLSLAFPDNPEIFTFTTEVSVGGTAAGAAIGFMVLGPFGGAVGAAIGGAASANQRANKFKENYPLQVMVAIDEQLTTMNVNQQVERYISQTFLPLEKLQNKLVTEVNSMLNHMQNKLAEYCGKQEAINHRKQQEISQMRADIEKIISEIKYFSQQLSKVSA
jgi:small GTP-binding protein